MSLTAEEIEQCRHALGLNDSHPEPRETCRNRVYYDETSPFWIMWRNLARRGYAQYIPALYRPWSKYALFRVADTAVPLVIRRGEMIRWADRAENAHTEYK